MAKKTAKQKAAARSRAASKARSMRRRISIIDVGTSLIVASAGTRAFFGTNLIPFVTEGWLVPATSGWSSSGGGGTGSAPTYALSAAEIIKGLIPGGEGSGAEAYSSGYFPGVTGMEAAVRRNLKEFGMKSAATIIVTPIAANMLKRFARKPIRDANKLLDMSGIGKAVGVRF